MSGNRGDLRTPLKRAMGLGSAKDGTGHFMLQRITAVGVLLAGAWLIGLLLSLNSSDYVFVRATVADPLNATVLIAFLVAAFWHAKLGLQVVIEDYIHDRAMHPALRILLILGSLVGVLSAISAIARIAMTA